MELKGQNDNYGRAQDCRNTFFTLLLSERTALAVQDRLYTFL